MKEVIFTILCCIFGWVAGYIWAVFLIGGRKYDLIYAILMSVGIILFLLSKEM